MTKQEVTEFAGSISRMQTRGFVWEKSGVRFLSAPGTGVSREIMRRSGKWIASAWVAYGVDGGWTGEPFDSLEACYVAAELENWGGL